MENNGWKAKDPYILTLVNWVRFLVNHNEVIFSNIPRFNFYSIAFPGTLHDYLPEMYIYSAFSWKHCKHQQANKVVGDPKHFDYYTVLFQEKQFSENRNYKILWIWKANV